MSDDFVSAGYLIPEGEKEMSEKEKTVIDTHEKFMREASKQTVESLAQIQRDVKAIASWVVFFGVMAILGIVLWGFILLLSF